MLKQIKDGVWVHQSEILKNNSIVVKGDDGVLLIDPGLTNDEMADIANDLHEIGQPVTAGFSTHPDWDHVLWNAELGDVPRYATNQAASFMKDFLLKDDWKKQAAEAVPEEIANEVPLELFGRLTALASEEKQIPWSGPRVRVLEHKAHAQGHAALFIEDSGVLIAGDMLSDVFIPMLNLQADDPIQDYLDALDLFNEVVDRITAVIPGHGSVAVGSEVRDRINLDRAYVQALRDGTNADDPRIGSSAKKGWEWVAGIHEWQAKQISEKQKAT